MPRLLPSCAERSKSEFTLTREILKKSLVIAYYVLLYCVLYSKTFKPVRQIVLSIKGTVSQAASGMILQNHRRLPVSTFSVKIVALRSLKRVTGRIFKISLLFQRSELKL
jgi:hypothetical protein